MRKSGQIDVKSQIFCSFIAFIIYYLFFWKSWNKQKKKKKRNKDDPTQQKWQKSDFKHFLLFFLIDQKCHHSNYLTFGEGVRDRLNCHILTKSVYKSWGGGRKGEILWAMTFLVKTILIDSVCLLIILEPHVAIFLHFFFQNAFIFVLLVHSPFQKNTN